MQLVRGTQLVLYAAVEQCDSREEARTLQAILIQPVRHDIGGRHQGYPLRKQLFHQAAQNHRIGNIKLAVQVKKRCLMIFVL